jgi:hypothetical protein
LEIAMQRELPTIDFASEAEVRSKAESRRTEEVSGLLRLFFEWGTARLRQSGRPIFEAVQPSHRPAGAGK